MDLIGGGGRKPHGAGCGLTASRRGHALETPPSAGDSIMHLTRAAVLILTASLVACGPDATGAAADPLAPAFAAGGSAASPCETFRAAGQTFAVNEYTFQGLATVWIGGRDAMEASVTTYLTGSIKQGNSSAGAQVVTTSHVFDFGDGNTFVTEDKTRLVPTATPGLLKLLSSLRVVHGTGTFAGVTQRPGPVIAGDPTSTMNLAAFPPVATWSFDARICGYGE
jgi:hypothetical protein